MAPRTPPAAPAAPPPVAARGLAEAPPAEPPPVRAPAPTRQPNEPPADDAPPPWGDDDEPPFNDEEPPPRGFDGPPRGFDGPPRGFDGPRGAEPPRDRWGPPERAPAGRLGDAPPPRLMLDDEPALRREEPARPSSAPASGSGPSFADFATLIRKKRPTLGGSLLQVRPLAFGPGAIVIGCDTSFDEQQLSSPDVRAFLEAEASALLGRATTVEVRRNGPGAATEPRPATLTEVEDGQRASRKAERTHKARENPAVQQVQDALGAKIARIRVVEED